MTGGLPVGYVGSGGGNFNISGLLASLAQTGGRLVQQANLPPGYVLLPNGTVAPASSVAGLFGSSGISSTTLLIGGGLIFGLILLGGRR